MKTQDTKSRKMLVKLVDGQGNIFTKIFSIELPKDFNQSDFAIDKLELAKEFVKPYPGALAKLASELISAQIDLLDKTNILASSTLDTKSKIRFISDHNLVTAHRIDTLKKLYPKVKAYRSEKGLNEITIDKFLQDFYPIDSEGKKWSPFKYITLNKDNTYTVDEAKVEEIHADAALQAVD